MTPRGRGTSPGTIDRIRVLAKAGLRRRDAAEQLNIPFSTLAKIAARHKIEFHGKPEQNPNSKRWANRPITPKPVAAPIADTTDEIARFIAERGVTRCPPAFAAPSPQGARP